VKVSFLILAAGRGTRFGGPVPKVFLHCAGQTVLERSVAGLARVVPDPDARELVLAVSPDAREHHVPPLLAALETAGLTKIVDGGATRQESMARAFAAADPDSDVIAVHDAARPLFSVETARRALEEAVEHGAALLAAPCADTLKRVDDSGNVVATVDRGSIWLAQTPQFLRRDIAEAALAHAETTGFGGTDDVSLVEHLGQTVRVVPSTSRNLKITTREELWIAEALLAGDDRP